MKSSSNAAFFMLLRNREFATEAKKHRKKLPRNFYQPEIKNDFHPSNKDYNLYLRLPFLRNEKCSVIKKMLPFL